MELLYIIGSIVAGGFVILWIILPFVIFQIRSSLYNIHLEIAITNKLLRDSNKLLQDSIEQNLERKHNP